MVICLVSNMQDDQPTMSNKKSDILHLLFSCCRPLRLRHADTAADTECLSLKPHVGEADH